MIDHSRQPAPTHSLPAFAPVPRQCQRHDGWTPDRQRRFIEALADLGSVRAAAHAVNMTPEGAYLLRRHPEAAEFRAAWESALALGIQKLEDIAMDRALNGVEVPIYCFGKPVGTRTVYNDALLMFLLRNRAAHRFHADNAYGNDAASRSQLERLKREWRAEWEAERERESAKSSEAARASLVAKLELMRQRRLGADWSQDEIDCEIIAANQTAREHHERGQVFEWTRPIQDKGPWRVDPDPNRSLVMELLEPGAENDSLLKPPE